MTPLDPAIRTALTVTAELLGLGRSLERLSRALTVLAFAGLLAPLMTRISLLSWTLLLLAGLAGLTGTYAASRVAFDARLLRQLASGEADLALLDRSLVELGLLPESKADRPIAPRLTGARRWLARQAVLLALQAGALATAGFAAL